MTPVYWQGYGSCQNMKKFSTNGICCSNEFFCCANKFFFLRISWFICWLITQIWLSVPWKSPKMARVQLVQASQLCELKFTHILCIKKYYPLRSLKLTWSFFTKKGDKRDFSYQRGIALVIHIVELSTKIMADGLYAWSVEHNMSRAPEKQASCAKKWVLSNSYY